MTPVPPGNAPAAPGPALDLSGLQDRRGLDLALMLGALVLAGLSTALISADLRAPVVSSERQVAVLAPSDAQVRRRLSGSLVWDELRPGDALYERDSIFVLPEGTATLELADGSQLEVDGSTLLVLERPRAVSLKEGGASGAPWRWQARAKSERAARPPGPVQLAAQGGGEIADPVALIAPAPNERRYYRGQIPTVLLKVERGAPGLVVQVAQDRGFTQVLQQAPVESGEHPVALARPGLYWWRVADGGGRPRSQARKFALVEDGPPLLFSPRPAGRVQRGSVPFSWGPLQGVDRYRLQISTDPEFIVAAVDVEVEGTRFRWATGDVPEGTYYWRVRAISQERADAPFTESRRLELTFRPTADGRALLEPEAKSHSGGGAR